MASQNKILYAIITALIILLWFKSCEGSKTKRRIIIPEINKTLQKTKPATIKRDTVYITKWKYKHKTAYVETENPVNTSLAELYKATKDSLDRFKLYLDAIQIKEFTNDYEDESIKLSLRGEAQGTVNWIEPSYTIKERAIQVADKKTFFRLLLGLQLTNTTTLDNLSYGLTAGAQNAKGNILRAGYSTSEGHNYITLGYDFSLFNLRK